MKSSLELLKGYLGGIVNAIMSSVDKCPLPMRVVFKRSAGEWRSDSPWHSTVGVAVSTTPGPPPQALSCPCPHPCPYPHPGGPVLLLQWVSLPSLVHSHCPHPKALQALGAAHRALQQPHTPAAHQGVGNQRGDTREGWGPLGRDGDTREGWGPLGRDGDLGEGGGPGEGWRCWGGMGTIQRRGLGSLGRDGEHWERQGLQGGMGNPGRVWDFREKPQKGQRLL